MNKQTIGLILAGVGLYWLWKQGYLFRLTTDYGQDQGPAAPANPPETAQGIAVTRELMLRKAQGNQFYINNGGLLNWHQWNYIHKEVRGIGRPEPQGIDLNINMTLDEWLSLSYQSNLGRLTDIVRSGGTYGIEGRNVRWLV